MNSIVSIGIWLIITILTILLFFVELILVIILFPFDKQRKIIHAQCFWWANAVIGSNPFWHIEASGLENIDKSRTYVIVANHQSLGDIVILYKTHMQFKWVAKDSLFMVPFIGWCLSLTKHIKLSRGKLSSIKKAYRQAEYWLKNNMSVLFFPEGTRSKTGDMDNFQNGAFKLAIKEKKPILPIAIEGTKDAIPKGSWVFSTKVFGKLTVLAPIETADLKPADFTTLRDTVYKTIESHIKA
jgi:1-acyl-sn-glycerol-3-phosphate acyltransferase